MESDTSEDRDNVKEIEDLFSPFAFDPSDLPLPSTSMQSQNLIIRRPSYSNEEDYLAKKYNDQKAPQVGDSYGLDPFTGNLLDGTEDFSVPAHVLDSDLHLRNSGLDKKDEDHIAIDINELQKTSPKEETYPLGSRSPFASRSRFEKDAQRERRMRNFFGSLTDPSTRITFLWTDIKYQVDISKKEKKIILQGINGQARPSEMVAILGGSGAGKTTLLNILAGRVTAGKIEGKILVNGERRSNNWKRIVGYVEQEDIMYRTLTVRETLRYAALLRLPRYLQKRQKLERAEQVMSDLGLLDCADTIIGDASHRGISGGERKRTAIGIELVTNPRLLFLDEPTSGLDAYTAYNIIEMVGLLAAKEAKTVIMTIHQPREEILLMFDKILLMSQGKTVFFGPTQVALDYFQSLGLSCPRYMNPADFFLDTITVDSRSEEAEKLSQTRVSMLQDHWASMEKAELDRRADINKQHGKNRSVSIVEMANEVYQQSGKKKVKRVHVDLSANNFWITELGILLTRNFKDIARDGVSLYANFIQTLFLFVIIGFTFFQLPLTQPGIQARVGVLFFLAVNPVFSVAQPLISLFPLERQIIIRERYASTYRTSSAYLAKAISIVPFRLFLTLCFGLSIYYIMGLNPAADRYFIFQIISVTLMFCSQGFGMLLGAASPTVMLGQIIGPMIIVVFYIYGGNFASTQTIPPELSWIQYLSLIRYAYAAYFQNEFAGEVFLCNNGQPPVNNQCSPGFATGDQVIVHYGFNTISITACCLILLGFGIAYHIFAYIALLFNAKPKMKLI